MPPVGSSRRTTARAAAIAVALTLSAFALAACAPEPTPGITPSTTPSAPAPSASPSPIESELPQGDDIELPADCTAIYSNAMLETLNTENPPLNDPGVTLFSTEMAAGLEVLDAAPTIRCSWGQPSEFGLASNVTIVDAEQIATLEQAMRDTGMSCEDASEGTLCRIQGEHLDGNDVVAEYGETHFLRGNAWVATHWINYGPEGYTEDIVATLWG